MVPRLQTAAALRIYMTNAWTQVRDTFETVLAGAPSFTISSVRDMHTPELEHIIDTYYQGTNLEGRNRVKLFNLIWDALYSEFAGRHGLYERNYAATRSNSGSICCVGPPYVVRLTALAIWSIAVWKIMTPRVGVNEVWQP